MLKFYFFITVTNPVNNTNFGFRSRAAEAIDAIFPTGAIYEGAIGSVRCAVASFDRSTGRFCPSWKEGATDVKFSRPGMVAKLIIIIQHFILSNTSDLCGHSEDHYSIKHLHIIKLNTNLY